ncbi:MAG: hypothetical protein FWG49_02245 [Leptospirales bacterium]|nr:hypothetical protein [Leptospirales bacterium]
MYKRRLTDKERDLIKDVQKFNRDYGSKGVTIKNRKIGWEDRFGCNGLILKNSVIKNVELQYVELKNMYIENSTIENVSVIEKSDLSGSTFRNVKFKNFKSINDLPSDLSDSIFIDCEFINCEYSDVYLGKEYRNCKFYKVKEIEDVNYYNTIVTDCTYTNCTKRSSYSDGRFENVIFKNSVVSSGFTLEYGKNIQFINCLTDFALDAEDGKIEDILVQNSQRDEKAKAEMVFTGNINNIIIRDCPLIVHVVFYEGSFNNISIINSKSPVVKFNNINLSNLLIKNTLVFHLTFDKANVSGDNRIENSDIRGNFYGRSKIRNLTITDCTFRKYVDIVFSELIGLRLVNNVYEIDDAEHAVKDAKYIDSDKFPLKSIPFPENNPYIEEYYYYKDKEKNKKTNK